jgi:hypothetical protein
MASSRKETKDDRKALGTKLLTMMARSAREDASYAQRLARGREYLQEGRVHVLSESSGGPPEITARVAGTLEYSVKIRVARRKVDGSCTCPDAETRHTCKHLAAVSLAWIGLLTGDAQETDAQTMETLGTPTAAPSKARVARTLRLAEALKATPLEDLARQLIEWTDADVIVRSRLDQWLRFRDAETHPETLLPLIRTALDTGDVFEPAETEIFARQVRPLLSLLARLRVSDPKRAFQRSAYALRCSAVALSKVDDSWGCVGDLFREFAVECATTIKQTPRQTAHLGVAVAKLLNNESLWLVDPDDFANALSGAARRGFDRAIRRIVDESSDGQKLPYHLRKFIDRVN